MSAEDLLARLKTEAASFRKAYEGLKDFLSGAEYDASDVKACLEELKESVISINFLLSMYAARMGRAEFTSVAGTFSSAMDNLRASIDAALLTIEKWPREWHRFIVRYALMTSKLKVEELKALLDLIDPL
jgi:predicted  nucleic acid-binding Zn-ribbon protein